MVNMWNSLPNLVHAESTDIFKTRLTDKEATLLRSFSSYVYIYDCYRLLTNYIIVLIAAVHVVTNAHKYD